LKNRPDRSPLSIVPLPHDKDTARGSYTKKDSQIQHPGVDVNTASLLVVFKSNTNEIEEISAHVKCVKINHCQQSYLWEATSRASLEGEEKIH
jgi:hypothetical protein